MQGSLSCVLVALFAWVVLANAAAVTPPQQSLLDKTGYEIFWINSDVAFLLTMDGASGAHLLYKSTNQGFVWKPVQLPNQNCYVIRIYQNPILPTQLLFVGPPEGQCGFTSNDAGLTFTSVTLPPLHHISFHPTLSGYAIGTTADSQVYYSADGYVTWNKIASTTSAEWILNADTSSQTKALSSSSIYLIKENNFGYSQDFGNTMETVITSVIGLHRTSNYIYVLRDNYTLIFGQNKDNLYSAYFPFGEVVPPVFSISDDTSGATWFSTDETFYWGNVYSAGSSGGVYTQSHLHVLKRDDAYLDIHSVRGMPGVHLLNEVVNYNDFRNPILKTYITFDNGAEWKSLAPPTGAAALNLYFNYKRAGHSFYTSSHTIGLIIANGYTSATISYNDPFKLNTYLSRDAGLTWEPLYNPGSYVFQVGANGGILVFAESNTATNHIFYSFDQGKTVTSMTVSNTPIYISTIETNSNGNSTVFVIFGVDDNGNGQIYSINFAGAYARTCVNADYENWAPSDGAESQCWLGQLIQYSRRIRTADCLDVRGELQVSATTCPCDYEDYECDLGFERHGNSCVQTGALPPSPPSHCTGTYHKTQGFRKVPGDKCEGGLDKGPQTLQCPKGKKGSSGWIAAVVIIVVLVVLGVVAFIIYRDPALREKVMGILRPNRGAGRYSRVGNAGRSSSLADESDFGIHDDLLEDGSEEEDAKVLHDNDISKASGRSEEAFSSRQDDSL